MIIETKKVNCQKHGEHEHRIDVTIASHAGIYCMLCWIETLGERCQEVAEVSVQ